MLTTSTDRQAMATLLKGLLVGADHMMDSVGHWADRLVDEQPALLTMRFLDQLDDEWLDALPPDCICERVGQIARRHVAAWHPGWPHLWGHILRVTGAAVAFAEEEGVDPVLAYMTGVLHDVAKLDEERRGEPHEELGAAFAARVLGDRLNPYDIELIQAAILKEDDGALGEILHDADKLDKIGAAGVLRRISTGTDTTWVPEALDRVADDRDRFPAMNSAASRDLAESKRAFLDWFLPLAEDVAADWR